jgi:hypothetical protein
MAIVERQNEKLWAQVRNNEIVYGPGPLPYWYIDGVRLDEMDVEKLAQVGFIRVWEKYDDEYDELIQDVEVGPDELNENGAVVRTYHYTYQPRAREVMKEKVNEHVSNLLARHHSINAATAREYKEVEEEARALRNDSDPDKEDYPLLQADVGITWTADGGVVQTIEEAAEVVLARAAGMKENTRRWRRMRIEAKSDIDAAPSHKAAHEIYKRTINSE